MCVCIYILYVYLYIDIYIARLYIFVFTLNQKIGRQRLIESDLRRAIPYSPTRERERERVTPRDATSYKRTGKSTRRARLDVQRWPHREGKIREEEEEENARRRRRMAPFPVVRKRGRRGPRRRKRRNRKKKMKKKERSPMTRSKKSRVSGFEGNERKRLPRLRGLHLFVRLHDDAGADWNGDLRLRRDGRRVRDLRYLRDTGYTGGRDSRHAGDTR